jgi:uncharacterized membrane protein YgcG
MPALPLGDAALLLARYTSSSGRRPSYTNYGAVGGGSVVGLMVLIFIVMLVYFYFDGKTLCLSTNAASACHLVFSVECSSRSRMLTLCLPLFAEKKRSARSNQPMSWGRIIGYALLCAFFVGFIVMCLSSLGSSNNNNNNGSGGGGGGGGQQGNNMDQSVPMTDPGMYGGGIGAATNFAPAFPQNVQDTASDAVQAQPIDDS